MNSRNSRPGQIIQKFLVGISCLLFAVACASGPEALELPSGPTLQIVGIEIYNALPFTVQDVTILVPLTGDYVSCGQILPDSSCSTTFPVRDYRDTPVQVSWKEQGEPHSTAPFKLNAPAGAIEGQQAYIRVEVFSAGQAGAKLILKEDTPR